MVASIKPWLDQAGKFPITPVGGIPHFNLSVPLDSPRTGVLHTTEGSWAGSLAVFKEHFAPHFMLGFDAEQQRVRIAQLVQVGTIGAALKAHNNKAIVQIEMIGFSKESPWLPDPDTVEALASLMAVCSIEYGIPLERAWKDGDFGVAGPNPHRDSGRFGTEPGWFGHGDCPAPDTHWDPGNLRWSDILMKARLLADDFGVRTAPAGPRAMTSSFVAEPIGLMSAPVSETIPAGAKSLLDLIAEKEAPAGYDTIFGNNQSKLPKPITAMTLSEVIAAGPSWASRFGSSACGRYQFVNNTLKGLRVSETLTGTELLDPALQDRLGYALLDRRGFENFLSGKITRTAFGLGLAKEWASFPVLESCQGANRVVQRGETFYAGDHLNRALITPEQVEAALDAIIRRSRFLMAAE